jgi:hypothetical protein
MATKTISKISGRLNFLYRKQSFLNLKLNRNGNGTGDMGKTDFHSNGNDNKKST